MNVAYNMDCMDYMRTLPDKAFDLAVVDPPYGCGGVNSARKRALAGDSTATKKIERTGGGWSKRFDPAKKL